MNTNRGILYPALHKFYSALSSLENFEKGKNFFDNISHLDNFFLEFRNITFVLQQSVAHTEFKAVYEELRNEYLLNDVCRWFIDKRNEVSKQKPFDLEKKIEIVIYSAHNTISFSKLSFTVDNDVEYSTLIESFKEIFMDRQGIEIMFSVEFSFYERGHAVELYDNFIAGINYMKSFITAMSKAVNEECKLSKDLERKIDALNFYRVPKDMLFIDDYVFYFKRNQFEKASRVEMWSGVNQNRIPIENFNKTPGDNVFDKFELMYLVIFQMQRTLLPTCVIVYDDDTFELLTFGGSIKTTIYRRLHEISKRIASDGIIQVLFVIEMYTYSPDDITNLDSRERIIHAQNEVLSFFAVDKDLRMKSHFFDTERVDDMEYVVSVTHGSQNEPVQPGFMNTIIKEFTRLHTK